MITKKMFLFIILALIIVSLFLFNKDVIFQEGNPLPVLKGIIQLNDTNTYSKIKDNPVTYITKTNNNEELFNYIEKQYNVKFVEQIGSGYIFEGQEKNVILTSKQYSRFYQVWGCFERSIVNLKFSSILIQVLRINGRA